jgi:taurine dioxygenase
MVSVEGMAEAEGRRLLDELIAHAIQPKYVYRHVWARDDIVMWDNRRTMHSVEPYDNVNARRIMHRVTLVGEGRPIAA